MSIRKIATAMNGANTNDASTGPIRIVQVSAPGATSSARCTRRSPELRDAAFATSSYPSATALDRPDCKRAPLRREKAGRKSRGPAPAWKSGEKVKGPRSGVKERGEKLSGLLRGQIGYSYSGALASPPNWRYTGGRVRQAHARACPTLCRRGG